ncbi:MAG: co-chaperone GroES [Clostridia bacterium]|nr:co-chaperone GroES [Clostridia bacterium]
MKIKPLFDRVIVESEKQDVSSSGIFIGASSQDKPQLGKILYVGEGNIDDNGKKEPMFVSVGDNVLFNKFSAVEATIDGKTVYILRQTDILAIIE